MIAALFALSLSLTACDPSDLLEFLGDTGLTTPAAAPAPDAAEDADADAGAADDDAGADDASRKRAPAPGGDAADDPGAGADDEPADGDAAPTGLSAIEQEIFDTLNATRADAGLDALALTADIAAGARDYSCVMAETGVFEHANLAEAGVNGENIAAGQRSAAEVHDGWMNSPGHRDNRMSQRWTEYGIGVCEDDGGRLYYTERFR